LRILAIETSCDETAIAVLECSGGLDKPTFKVFGNALNSQIDLHKEFGGVVPDIAKREHQKWLPLLLDTVFKKVCFDIERPNIDLIAVTAGPGLEPALWTGITFAEELGKKWHIPVMPVNHMEGHILSVLIHGSENPNDQGLTTNEIQFPALALLVSGGHTEIVLVSDYGSYQILGRTRDDAVGEAFDKVARILGLPYPGGPEVAKLAAKDRQEYTEAELEFTMPMLNSGNLDFSYSGLKTAVLYKAKDLGTLTEDDKMSLARAFEDAAIGALVKKTKSALDEHMVKTLIIGGGVSANTYLRESLTTLIEEYPEVTLMFPIRSLTTDNAIMIAVAAYIESHKQGPLDMPIKASGNLSL
jgi:N6-L-threonylcarbamoyladenine synthase